MQRVPIKSLTGLRFFAAFCVVIAHAASKLVPFADDEPVWHRYVSQASALGMTLFFVLSGFVCVH